MTAEDVAGWSQELSLGSKVVGHARGKHRARHDVAQSLLRDVPAAVEEGGQNSHRLVRLIFLQAMEMTRQANIYDISRATAFISLSHSVGKPVQESQLLCLCRSDSGTHMQKVLPTAALNQLQLEFALHLRNGQLVVQPLRSAQEKKMWNIYFQQLQKCRVIICKPTFPVVLEI